MMAPHEEKKGKEKKGKEWGKVWASKNMVSY